MMQSLRIQSVNSEFTQELGRMIGEQAAAGDVFLLTG